MARVSFELAGDFVSEAAALIRSAMARVREKRCSPLITQKQRASDMKTWFVIIVGVGLSMAAPVLAQTQTPAKRATEDGNSSTSVGPGGAASKQKTQSLSHSDPGSAYKQKTQGDLPEVGPASGAYNGNVPRSKY
jgi:hypothetical protein